MRSRVCVVLCAGWLAGAVCSISRGEDLSGYKGPELYRMYCASCHGVEGHGDGPVAASLKVSVPDLTRIAARRGGTFPTDQIRIIIDGRASLPPHGTRDMPVWGWAFGATGTDPQSEYRAQGLIGLLMEYLRSIQRN